MDNPKKDDTGMFSHGQSPHKRKCQQTNDENAKRQQRSKKTSSRSRMVLEDVTNIPHKKGMCTILLRL